MASDFQYLSEKRSYSHSIPCKKNPVQRVLMLLRKRAFYALFQLRMSCFLPSISCKNTRKFQKRPQIFHIFLSLDFVCCLLDKGHHIGQGERKQELPMFPTLWTSSALTHSRHPPAMTPWQSYCLGSEFGCYVRFSKHSHQLRRTWYKLNEAPSH